MKILVLASRSPWPPSMADSMTVNRWLRYLARQGHEVHLACFVESREQENCLRAELGSVIAHIEVVRVPVWLSRWKTLVRLPFPTPMQVDYYRSTEMFARIDKLTQTHRYDACYTHLIRMAEYSRHLKMPKVIGVQISQALNLGRMRGIVKDPLRKIFYWIESNRVAPYEASVAEDFDYAMLCGQSDIDAIRERAPLPNAVICPHGQDVPATDKLNLGGREKHSIILSGVMSTYTNVDAAKWFANDILPIIRQRVPDATFYIVGRNPQPAVQRLHDGIKVIVTGEVEDVYEWLCGKAVAVAPLRVAAGMQNKIIQAMASQTPVVATSVANEGVGARNGENILIGDDSESIAKAVLSLLEDSPLSRRIGANGRSFVEENWTWDALFQRLENYLECAVTAHEGRSAA